jgi:uncharacterized protein YeaO (DUF488 family)
MIRIKRIYEEPAASDGARVLVDRLWPRGVSKEQAALDVWLKEAAPSQDLRTWFGHKPERFKEFSEKYREELQANPAIAELKKIITDHKNVTLLYAAKDPTINHAAVLLRFLRDG